MVNTVYIEESVLEHTRTQAILTRYAHAQHIVIERYGELFNAHAQNFRLQKLNPALILAEKRNTRVHSTPSQYETGGAANYYFSHMLNCLYDCRYCFLQGMFQSANYLLFVNYQDFWQELVSTAEMHQQDDKPCWFFSGYDCDSLAMEPITGFAEWFMPKFAQLPHAVLELRTKSTQIRPLLRFAEQQGQVLDNIVVAFSLSPENIVGSLEHGTPSLAKRLAAISQLQQQGWRVGLRFDPIIWHQNYEDSYQDMLDTISQVIDFSKLDSITVGGFRLPKGYYKNMRKLYPQAPLLSGGIALEQDMYTYQREIEHAMFAFMHGLLRDKIEIGKLYFYPTDEHAK